MKTLSFTGTINCRESLYPRLLPFHTPFSPLFSRRLHGASCCTVLAAVEIIHSTLNKRASFAETFPFFFQEEVVLATVFRYFKFLPFVMELHAAKEFERHVFHSMRIAGISPCR